MVHLGAPDFLGLIVVNEFKKYSSDELANLLVKEGLTRAFVDLRIFSCGSALVPPVDHETKSFAENLLFSMRRLGYSNLRISGYNGSVRSAYSYRQIMSTADYTASQHKGVEIGIYILRAKDGRTIFS